MAWRGWDEEPLSLEETFQKMTVDDLKPIVKLLGGEVPTRKTELVPLLTRTMSDPARVRGLYQRLVPLAQSAVQEAAYHPDGELNLIRFQAKYRDQPQFDLPTDSEHDRWSYRRGKPTLLRLFLPRYSSLPTDLRSLLRSFVPEPAAFAVPTLAELPATIPVRTCQWEQGKRIEQTADTPLRVRETAREALRDLPAMLRLIGTGAVRVSEKKRQPTAASLKAITAILQGGDFYQPDDEEEAFAPDPATDLAIKAFAWPMLLQAADLAQGRGGKLELTPEGRKASAHPVHELVRKMWKKWLSSNLLDEFSRVDAIKGQTTAKLTALARRRKLAADYLSRCPVGKWLTVDAFFRLVRVGEEDFELAHHPYRLYVCERQYGSFHDGSSDWETLEGRYLLAFLFEYAATLGLLDVAYLPPQGRRDDFSGHWGTDDLSCLSRYDGLLYVRLNALGAWGLGLAETFVPPVRDVKQSLQVLANLDVVVTKPPLDPGDQMLLDRFAEASSELVWRLNAGKIQTVLEEGGSLNDLTDLLAARVTGPLPQTVQVFLDDLRQKAGQLRDLGSARMIECADKQLAQTLAADPLLRKRCQLAGERWLVFQADQESEVRKALRRLGYVLPARGN